MILRSVCCRGKKSIHHHRGTPLFSVCRPTPRSQSKKRYGVYHFPGTTREKGIHHRSGKKGIHHRASDPEKGKKGGSPRWWCILFSFLCCCSMTPWVCAKNTLACLAVWRGTAKSLICRYLPLRYHCGRIYYIINSKPTL